MGTATMKTRLKKPFYLQTANPISHIFHGPYVIFPLIASLVWLAGLLALVALWVTDGRPQYSRGASAAIVFISDVGGAHKTLFIFICCFTAGFWILSLLAERWLRHVDRLPVDLRPREKIFDWLAIFFGIVGSVGLIMLSIFDTFNHSRIHWSMTLVFVVGTAISAIFQSAEIWSLHKDHPDRRSLLRNSIIKLAVVGLAIICAIAFGITYGICGGDGTATGSRSAETCSTITGAAGALEWTVAFILVFYFLTLILDLWPAGKSSPRYMRRLAKWQAAHGEGQDFTGRHAFNEYPERWQGDAMAQEEMQQTGTGTTGTGSSGAPIVSAAVLEERMRREMWERNNGLDNRSSMASSQQPMVR